MIKIANILDNKEIDKINGFQLTFEKPNTLKKKLVTSTQFSKNNNFFKKFINNFSFILKLLIKKNLRI